MINVNALVFDLDGTLVDSKHDLYLSVRFLQKKMGHRLSSEDEVASYVGNGVVKLVERALPGVKGKRFSDALILFKRYYHRHCLDHTRLYPGVAETLRHFRHKQLAVVTNKPTRISKRILTALGIGSFFRIVLGGDALREKKPDPRPVQMALQSMGIASPREAAMVGDGQPDILAGKSHGTWTCGIISNIGDTQKMLKCRPDFVILNMYELMHVFS